ncbi:MAG TPA: ribonuclease Z, partial [Elusimicrobiales bacterium]|nr:ribonuclease Z [Elusimicrobiales bacterium]
MQNLELVVLGSGGFSPADDGREVRNPSGYALLTPEQDSILLDFGFGNLRQYARAGLKIERIKYAFLSHFHLDHWGDLLALLFVLHYNIKPRSGKLVVGGPAGTKKLLQNLSSATFGYIEPSGYQLETAEFSPDGEAVLPDLKLAAFAVNHTPEALAYKLRLCGKTLVYTGDARPTPGLETFCRNADLLIADAGLANAQLNKPHMTVAQACELAAAAQPKLTLISHLSPDAAP